MQTIHVEPKDWRKVFSRHQRQQIRNAELSLSGQVCDIATPENTTVVIARMAKMLDALAVGQECHIP